MLSNSNDDSHGVSKCNALNSNRFILVRALNFRDEDYIPDIIIQKTVKLNTSLKHFRKAGGSIQMYPECKNRRLLYKDEDEKVNYINLGPYPRRVRFELCSKDSYLKHQFIRLKSQTLRFSEANVMIGHIYDNAEYLDIKGIRTKVEKCRTIEELDECIMRLHLDKFGLFSTTIDLYDFSALMNLLKSIYSTQSDPLSHFNLETFTVELFKLRLKEACYEYINGEKSLERFVKCIEKYNSSNMDFINKYFEYTFSDPACNNCDLHTLYRPEQLLNEDEFEDYSLKIQHSIHDVFDLVRSQAKDIKRLNKEIDLLKNQFSNIRCRSINNVKRINELEEYVVELVSKLEGVESEKDVLLEKFTDTKEEVDRITTLCCEYIEEISEKTSELREERFQKEEAIAEASIWKRECAEKDHELSETNGKLAATELNLKKTHKDLNKSERKNSILRFENALKDRRIFESERKNDVLVYERDEIKLSAETFRKYIMEVALMDELVKRIESVPEYSFAKSQLMKFSRIFTDVIIKTRLIFLNYISDSETRNQYAKIMKNETIPENNKRNIASTMLITGYFAELFNNYYLETSGITKDEVKQINFFLHTTYLYSHHGIGFSEEQNSYVKYGEALDIMKRLLTYQFNTDSDDYINYLELNIEDILQMLTSTCFNNSICEKVPKVLLCLTPEELVMFFKKEYEFDVSIEIFRTIEESLKTSIGNNFRERIYLWYGKSKGCINRIPEYVSKYLNSSTEDRKKITCYENFENVQPLEGYVSKSFIAIEMSKNVHDGLVFKTKMNKSRVEACVPTDIKHLEHLLKFNIAQNVIATVIHPFTTCLRLSSRFYIAEIDLRDCITYEERDAKISEFLKEYFRITFEHIEAYIEKLRIGMSLIPEYKTFLDDQYEINQKNKTGELLSKQRISSKILCESGVSYLKHMNLVKAEDMKLTVRELYIKYHEVLLGPNMFINRNDPTQMKVYTELQELQKSLVNITDTDSMKQNMMNMKKKHISLLLPFMYPNSFIFESLEHYGIPIFDMVNDLMSKIPKTKRINTQDSDKKSKSKKQKK